MNLLINNYCNLKCSYCFAQEEMHSKEAMNITMENFCKYLDFLKKSNITEVRLIGGEPTLHPELEKLIDKVIEYNCFTDITIFTNLSFDRKIANLFVKNQEYIGINLLPNINDLDLLIPSIREKTLNNLAFLSQNLRGFDRISLNLFSPDQDLKKWEEIICKYNIKSIRWTVVAPNCEIKEDFDFYNYFHQFQPLLLEMADWHMKYGIYLDSDCSNFPLCCLDDWALSYIIKIQKNFFGNRSYCSNIVGDIAPDLTIRECFVSTGNEVKKLTDFENFMEFDAYYSYVRAERTKGKIARKECLNCPTYKTYNSSCCCIGYCVL